jgi:hypothetical protein
LKVGIWRRGFGSRKLRLTKSRAGLKRTWERKSCMAAYHEWHLWALMFVVGGFSQWRTGHHNHPLKPTS